MGNKNFTDEQWALFTDELKETFDYIDNVLALEYPTPVINDNYFLLAIFKEKKCLAYHIIEALLSSVALKLIIDGYTRLLAHTQLSVIKPNRVIQYSDEFLSLIDESMEEIEKTHDKKIGSIHLVLSYLNPKREHKNVKKIMAGAGLTYDLLLSKIASIKGDIPMEEEDEAPVEVNKKNNTTKKNISFELFNPFGIPFETESKSGQYISSYCHNLNKKAKEGKIDNVIGRDKEITHISQVFNRRRKNNVILVGDKGSGKTAICESLAWLIVNNKAPYSLRDKIILKLDISSMIAGTTYRGMFEERAKGLFNELQKNPQYILFIDDFHLHTPKRDMESSTDITPFLKETIGDGSLKVIATCTQKGYHRKFDSDASLANNFQRIDLTNLQDDEIRTILLSVKSTYEKFHAITLSEEIIDTCITLCKKYVTDRDMPDSVIDLIDEIGACVSNKYQESEEIKQLKKEHSEIIALKKASLEKLDFGDIEDLANKEKEILSQIKAKEKRKQFPSVKITKDIVYQTLSNKTGIPIQNLTEDDKKDLVNINQKLKSVIIGQDEAIDIICKTIKRKKLGLHNGKGTAILCQGPTGVGKTFLAKKLAEELFGNENAMIRFDMSEYADRTSINKLIGSSAGYVGYEEGGLLTEAVKNKKHCILLLDEFEKANDEIFNIFLQVFDEGFLTDNTGQKVDFRNVIILLTSNIGAKFASENSNGIGFGLPQEGNDERIKNILSKQLKKRFSPEFLNRLDSIIYFNPLTNENLKLIIKLEVDKSVKRFKDIGYTITYNDNIIDYIFDKVKEESDYGARPVIRAVQNELEDVVTDAILDGNVKETINVDVVDNIVVVC